MRKYFAKITDSGDHPQLTSNHVEIREKPFPALETGKEGTMHLISTESGDEYELKAVGLGYHDFEDQQDYDNNVASVVEEKMEEHGVATE